MRAIMAEIAQMKADQAKEEDRAARREADRADDARRLQKAEDKRVKEAAQRQEEEEIRKIKHEEMKVRQELAKQLHTAKEREDQAREEAKKKRIEEDSAGVHIDVVEGRLTNWVRSCLAKKDKRDKLLKVGVLKCLVSVPKDALKNNDQLEKNLRSMIQSYGGDMESYIEPEKPAKPPKAAGSEKTGADQAEAEKENEPVQAVKEDKGEAEQESEPAQAMKEDKVEAEKESEPAQAMEEDGGEAEKDSVPAQPMEEVTRC